MLPLSLLMAKSVRVLFRKKSFGTLTMGSSILIFGLLFLMWYMSRHQQLRFMTSDGYQHLQFTMECEVKGRNGDDQRLVCKPDKSTLDRSTQGLSPSEAVFSIVNSGYIITESEEASKLALLLSSVMMNGLPLLGLDDFVYFSDFVNEEIGSDAKMALLSSPGYKHKFSNFLQVRHNRILLYPDSCWARQFVSYMKNATATFSHLTVSILRSEQQALHHCCHDVWAIIEIQAPIVLESGQHKGRVKQNCAVFDATDRLGNTTSAMQDSASSGTTVVPEVTIRMHPAAVPDTRNFEYSPLNRHLLSRQQSGQLLYFTSGFLTLQLEVQNFLASSSSGSGAGLGGREVRSKVFSGHNAEAVLHPALAAHSLAQALAAASTTEEVQQAVLNATRAGAGVRPTLAFPLFHRAFPTHNNHQVSTAYIIGVIILLCSIVR